MAKLGFSWGGYKFWTDRGYLHYRSIYGKSFRVLLSDIESVSLDTGKRGKNIIKINGKGTTLAEETLPKPWCEKAQGFIRKEIETNKPANTPTGGNYDDLEKLAELKEKDLITQAEYDAKKRQILGL